MRRLPPLLVIAALPASGCTFEDGLGVGPGAEEELVCDLDPAYLADGGVGRDGIPALSDPLLVPISPFVPANAYVRDEDRVIAVRVGPEWIVVPHNIMWQHEIVNFNGGAGLHAFVVENFPTAAMEKRGPARRSACGRLSAPAGSSATTSVSPGSASDTPRCRPGSHRGGLGQ